MASLRTATLAFLLALALAPAAGAVPAGTTVLLDRPSGFGALPFDGFSDAFAGRHALSANGCFVVYVSKSDDLIATDEDAATNVYRQDRCAPGTRPVQVNTSATGAPAEAGSFAADATISADGRFVAFRSSAENLHPAARGAEVYVFVKDLQTGAVELVSRGTGAAGAPVRSPFAAVIAGNGGSVLFVAEGPVDGDNVNGVADQSDAYVRVLGANITTLVSLTKGGARGGGVDDSDYSSDIDYSGRNVVFVSENRLDDVADTDDSEDAYERRGIGTMGVATQLVSFTAGADSAEDVAISSDASRIAWAEDMLWISTCAPCGAAVRVDQARPGGTNTGQNNEQPFFAQTVGSAPQRVYWATPDALDPADANGERDVYSTALAGGADPVRSATRAAANGLVDTAAATDDASVVVFLAERTTNLPGSDSVHGQVFQRTGDLVANLVEIAGIQPRPSQAGNADLGPLHAVSGDGHLVVFKSEAPVLGSPFFSGRRADEILARDTVSGSTTLVSVAADGSTAANTDARDPSVDAAGRRIVFTSSATNLVPGVPPGGDTHVYLRDLQTRTTVLVDRTAAGVPASDGAEAAQISGDGTKVVFASFSDDLPGAVFGGPMHIYRVDLATGTIVLVDRAGSGTPGDQDARWPDISFDGRRIAFASHATNLGAPADAGDQIYVRDLAAATTTWASVPQTLANPLLEAIFPSLSGDGNRVAFQARRPLSPEDSSIFVRDLAARQTTVVSPPGVASTEDDNASISRDGRKVGFVRFPDRGFAMTLVRDLGSGAVVRSDLRNGLTTPARLGAFGVSLDADGSCVAFESGSDDLVSPSYGPDFVHVFLRALTADCPAGPAHGASDRTAPRISGARVTHRRFALARRKTARIARVKRGTTFVFRLSEKARTTITVARRKRHHRFAKVVALTRAGTRQGVNRVPFTGRVGKLALRRGPYRAAIVSTDRAGNRSKRVFVRFTVVR